MMHGFFSLWRSGDKFADFLLFPLLFSENSKGADNGQRHDKVV